MSPQGPGGDRGVHGLQHLVHQTLLQRPANSESRSLLGLVEPHAPFMHMGCFFFVVFFFLKGSEVTEQVLHTVSKSSSLEEITLENTGLKS